MNLSTLDNDRGDFLDSYDINDLLDPDKGYTLVRGFLTSGQADRYRQECEHFLRTSKRVYDQVNRYSKYDYLYSPNGAAVRGASGYRIYQSLQDKHSRETAALFRKVISFRNRIEENWLHDEVYRHVKEKYAYNYVQVNRYAEGQGITRHRDFQGVSPYPLLQCVILLSQPQVDYLEGDLVLYTKSGRSIKVQSSSNMQKGDALFFDKSLFHEVEPSQASQLSAVGRWSAIIGARYPNPPKPSERIKSVVREQIYRVKRALSRYLGLLSDSGD